MSFLEQLIKNLAGSASSSIKQTAKSKLSQVTNEAANKAATAITDKAFTKTKTFTFTKIPETIDEFKALPEAALTDPFASVALTILALAAYTKNSSAGLEMFKVLRGPSPFSQLDIQRTNNALSDGKEYIPMSYFEGSSPDNNYTPETPYKITVYQTQNTDTTLSEGYKRMFVKSSGADSERVIILRLKPSTNQWFLNEHVAVLAEIRTPKSADPWA